MHKQLLSLALLAGLTLPVGAEEPQDKSTVAAQAAELKSTPDEMPAGIHRFNGMLVGRLAAKDVEKGTFLVLVEAVPRVWKNSQAEDPKSIVGKTVEVTGVFGKFLDVLVVMRKGETIEFECKHDGEHLMFPGELLRKVAPYRPEDYPVLPEEFRGFQGTVRAEVVNKDPETFELIVQVEKVVEPWQENTAKQPKSIEGKQMMLAGFWNRRDEYHKLKVGDRFEAGMQHIGLRSDHLTIAKVLRPLSDDSQAAAPTKEDKPADDEGLSSELRGFRGMLVGRLVEKDVERGTFTITVDAVPRVWKNNQASNPKSIIGKQVGAEGAHGKMLDALVVARVGETIELGALHDGGDRVRIGEVLRKVAPVKPGDYPELPNDFRGFKGILVGKVARKNEELLELIIEIQQVEKTSPDSQAKKTDGILGRPVMLAGFWQRKDAYHDLSVGDVIRFGVEHPETLSDHLTVIEPIEKVEK